MTDVDWRGWSDWHNLGLQQGFSFVAAPKKPGTYVIATDRPLHRAVGKDEDGILTIGESASLHRRMQVFAKCALTHSTPGHISGWRFSFFRFDRTFPFSSLRVRWKTTATKKAAYELEGRMLLRYLQEHLELPPLNYSFNWSPFEKDGWDLFDVMIGLKKPPKNLAGPSPKK